MDILEHLNPSKTLELRISSRLFWILRKALRKGNPAGHISLMDASVLDSDGVYYVPPFHTELKRHLVFDPVLQGNIRTPDVEQDRLVCHDQDSLTR